MSNHEKVTEMRASALGRTDGSKFGGHDYFYVGAYTGGGDDDDLDNLINRLLNDDEFDADKSGGGDVELDVYDDKPGGGDVELDVYDDKSDGLIAASSNFITDSTYNDSLIVPIPITRYETVESADFKNDNEHSALTSSSEEAPLVVERTLPPVKKGGAEGRPDNVKTDFNNVKKFITTYLQTIKIR